MTLLERSAVYLRTAATGGVDQALEDFHQHERSLPIKCEKLVQIRRKILAAKRRLLKLSEMLAEHKATE
jgi:hypothetical protein